MANAVAIGVESDMSLQRREEEWNKEFFFILDNVFLTMYYFELLVRISGGGWKFIRSQIGIFDITLVMLGTLGSVSSSLTHLSQLQPVMVLRTLRLLRMARTLRMIGLFEDLWKTVRGLTHCVAPLISTITLLTITLYIAPVWPLKSYQRIHCCKTIQIPRQLSTIISTHSTTLYSHICSSSRLMVLQTFTSHS